MARFEIRLGGSVSLMVAALLGHGTQRKQQARKAVIHLLPLQEEVRRLRQQPRPPGDGRKVLRRMQPEGHRGEDPEGDGGLVLNPVGSRRMAIAA